MAEGDVMRKGQAIQTILHLANPIRDLLILKIS